MHVGQRLEIIYAQQEGLGADLDRALLDERETGRVIPGRAAIFYRRQDCATGQHRVIADQDRLYVGMRSSRPWRSRAP